MPDEREQKRVMDDIQRQEPGAKNRLQGLREHERIMSDFIPDYPIPDRSNIVRMRRDIYEELDNG